MTGFHKLATIVLILTAPVSTNSCNSDEEQREEANATVVNIEKGVANPVWTTDAEPVAVSNETKQAETPAPEPAEPREAEQAPEEEPRKEVQTPQARRQEVKSEATTEARTDNRQAMKKEENASKISNGDTGTN